MQEYPQWFKQGEKVYVVNCTNSGFNDNTTMLKQLPHDTQVLLFNGNKLPHLDWNVFGVWDDHVDLKVIDLSNNQIEDIDGKAFHKVKNGEETDENMISATCDTFIQTLDDMMELADQQYNVYSNRRVRFRFLMDLRSYSSTYRDI